MKKIKLNKLLVTGVIASTLLTPKPASAMGISSHCGILMDQLNGRVLYEKCGDNQMYIASITKILTALVAIENADLDAWVEITDNTIRQVGSSLYLTLGDEMKLIDLLYGLMLRSGNDSAMAIAEFVGGDEAGFVEMMNEKAREIGMENSAFQNPSGLDETTYNLSTAHDMALVMQYAMNNPIFREIAGTQTHRATTKNEKTYSWTNKHKLITGFYEPAIAGKTGFTKQARRTLVTSATRDDLELIVVTLKAGDDWNDHMSLFEYGFNNYEIRQVVEVGELHFSEEQKSTYGITERLFVNRPVYLTVRSDDGDTVKTNLMLDEEKNNEERVGTLQVIMNDEVQEEVGVYQISTQETSTESSSWLNRVFSWFTGMVNP